MKKLFAIIAAITIIAGCGKAGKNESNEHERLAKLDAVLAQIDELRPQIISRINVLKKQDTQTTP